MQLASQHWISAATTQALLDAFRDAGTELRFVGGCVRDAVMGRPVGDIDCTTPATPDAVMALLTAADIKYVPTGLAHGTVTAIIDRQPFEITTLRRDTSCDGRHAEVAFTDSWEDDAQRRDFTLNALYCDAQGHITDFHHGIADAQAGRILFIGHASDRIREDGLRILRFFRFFATHGQAPLSADALAACHDLRGMLQHLSGERIQQEMRKLLAAPQPVPALLAMADCGVLQELIPLDHLPLDALARYDALCAHLSLAPDIWLRLALIIRHASAPTLPLAQRWKLSNADAAWLHHLCDNPASDLPADDYQLTRALRRDGRALRSALLLRDAAEQSLDLPAVARHYARCHALTIPQFPVTGADLLAAGYAQSAALGAALKTLETAWEDAQYQPDKAALLSRLGSL